MGNRYRFRLNTSSSLPPSFGAEIQRDLKNSATSTDTITLATGVGAGKILVIMMGTAGSAQVSSATDTTGANIWAVVNSSDGFAGSAILWAYITSPLSAGNTVTISRSTSSVNDRYYSVCTLDNCSSSGQPNMSTTQERFGTSVTMAASTSAAATCLVCVLASDGNGGASSYSGGNFTTIASSSTYASGANRAYFQYANLSTSGSKTPGGAWGTSLQQHNCMMAFK